MTNMRLSSIILVAPLMMSTALTAYAGGHGAKTIGQTTALIAEAGLATTELKDGESIDVGFNSEDKPGFQTFTGERNDDCLEVAGLKL